MPDFKPNYIVESDETIGGLVEKVNRLIDDGYVPVGAIVVRIQRPYGAFYLQTMVKTEYYEMHIRGR